MTFRRSWSASSPSPSGPASCDGLPPRPDPPAHLGILRRLPARRPLLQEFFGDGLQRRRAGRGRDPRLFAVLSYLFWYIAVVILFASIGYWLGWGFMSLIGFSETGFVAVAIGLLLGAVFAVAAFVTGVLLAALVVITAVAGAHA